MILLVIYVTRHEWAGGAGCILGGGGIGVITEWVFLHTGPQGAVPVQ